MLQNMTGMIVHDRKTFGPFDSIHLRSMKIRLPALGMSGMPVDDFPSDFTFRVGRNEHKCWPFVALFFFTKPNPWRCVDAKIDEHRVQTKDRQEIFENFFRFVKVATSTLHPRMAL